MKKQSINRKHNFSDPELHLRSMKAIQLAHRDLESFKQYGYDLERLKRFKALADRFRDLPDDDELLGDQMLMTEKKYQAAHRLRASIRSLMTRVAIKYSNRSGRYRKFGTAKLGDMTDAHLLFCARRVVRVARQQMDFLAEVGVNESLLARILEAAKDFEQAVNLQHDRIADRDIAVERRIELGNRLYEELVVVCDIGKDIWKDLDKDKYEQYCLYESNNEYKKELKARKAQGTRPTGSPPASGSRDEADR